MRLSSPPTIWLRRLDAARRFGSGGEGSGSTTCAFSEGSAIGAGGVAGADAGSPPVEDAFFARPRGLIAPA
jgi:hypothetical protein